jgi:hypothetical protein
VIAVGRSLAKAMFVVALVPSVVLGRAPQQVAAPQNAVRASADGAARSAKAERVVKTYATPQSAPLVRAGDMVYEGAFRLPLEDWGYPTFAYGGTALAFNPVKGSLFLTGHDWQQHVAEISVPAIRRSASVSGLATAAMVQPMTDATEGKMPQVGPNTVKVGGLLPYNGRLYLTAYLYYDGTGGQRLSHFVSGTDLSVTGDVQGPFAVGNVGAGFVSGYFGLVPSAWRSLLGGPVLNGNCCLGVVSRTSYGPAVFAMNPADLGVKASTPATPLVYYPSTHTTLGAWDSTNPYFNGTTEVRGVVFPEGTRSVLFFGRHGVGPFCYGSGEECKDPTDNSKGTHGHPYAYQVWAYDAIDLADVAAGRKQPWDVKPYATWPLDLGFAASSVHLNGAAYDPASGRIFVSQAFGDGNKPLIHVFTLRGE